MCFFFAINHDSITTSGWSLCTFSFKCPVLFFFSFVINDMFFVISTEEMLFTCRDQVIIACKRTCICFETLSGNGYASFLTIFGSASLSLGNPQRFEAFLPTRNTVLITAISLLNKWYTLSLMLTNLAIYTCD